MFKVVVGCVGRPFGGRISDAAREVFAGVPAVIAAAPSDAAREVFKVVADGDLTPVADLLPAAREVFKVVADGDGADGDGADGADGEKLLVAVRLGALPHRPAYAVAVRLGARPHRPAYATLVEKLLVA